MGTEYPFSPVLEYKGATFWDISEFIFVCKSHEIADVLIQKLCN